MCTQIVSSGAFDPPGAGGKGVSGQGHDGGNGLLGVSPRQDGSSYRMGGGGAGEAGNTDGHGEGGDGRYEHVAGPLRKMHFHFRC
jgi:hypothetical protein